MLYKAKLTRKQIKKQPIKTYILSIALYNCETWTLTQKQRVRRTEKRSNEEVLIIVNEKRDLIETIDNRRGKIVGHLIRHDDLFETILEAKIGG